jgi:ketosteroid isomerase-like protein
VTAEENIEVVRRANAAWNSNDWEELEALTDPDVQAVSPEGWPETEGFKGWPAVRRQYERLKDMEHENAELTEIEPMDEHRVLSRVRWTGTGRGSGLEIDMSLWVLQEIRDGRITRIEFFLDEESAKQAAGRA